MFHEDHNAPPLNPLPPMVALFALAIAGVELYLQAAGQGFIGGRAGVGLRLEWMTSFAFLDPVFSWMLETGRMPPEHLLRLVSYAFIHAGFTHAAFAVVMLLAIGKMVAEVFSQFAFAVIFLASIVCGALAYGLALDTQVPLVGAFPGIYGLIGALTYMLWIKAKVTGEGHVRAFSLLAGLMGIQLLFKLLFGGGDDWVADLTGAAVGFGLSFLFAPGGHGRIVDWLERVRRR